MRTLWPSWVNLRHKWCDLPQGSMPIIYSDRLAIKGKSALRLSFFLRTTWSILAHLMPFWERGGSFHQVFHCANILFITINDKYYAKCKTWLWFSSGMDRWLPSRESQLHLYRRHLFRIRKWKVLPWVWRSMKWKFEVTVQESRPDPDFRYLIEAWIRRLLYTLIKSELS